jgi:hypothetical protein
MYWSDARKGTLEQKHCFTSGPPYYYWDIEGSLTNLPTDASEL